MTAIAAGAVCANIGPKERRMRMMSGVIGAVLTVGLAAYLIVTHAPLWARALVAIPAALGAFGFFQARAQTCVMFAAQDIKVLGDSRADSVKVNDQERAQISRQARGVYMNSIIATVIVSAFVVFLP